MHTIIREQNTLDYLPWQWLDSSDESTVTTSGSDVTGWTDKSGNANHVIGLGTGDNPDYSSTQNGLKVISFNGINEGLQYTTPSRLKSENFTALFVYKPTDTGRGVLMGDFDKANSYDVNFELSESANQKLYYDDNPNITGQINTVNINDWNIMIVKRRGDSFLFYNSSGFIETVIDASAAASSFDAAQRGSIGRDSREAPTAFKGSIGELLIWERSISEIETSDIIEDRIVKWDIPV